MKTGFISVHPLVAFSYYLLMLVFTMLFLHPFFLLILLVTAIIYGLMVRGRRAMKQILLMIPFAIVIMVINPLFNHRGEHILFYLFNKPITQEALIYGIIMATILMTILILFIGYEKIMDSHKFLALFSQLLPRVAFVTAMTLRYIPLLTRRVKEISQVQRTVGVAISTGNRRMKIKDGIQVLSILTTWSLEDALMTAESMTARGYGLKKRTSYKKYKMESRDIYLLIFQMLLAAIIITAKLLGIGNFEIYPSLEPMVINYDTLVLFGAMTGFASMPIIVDTKEALIWRSTR